MPRHPWLPHPRRDPPPPTRCPTGRPHFRTAALALAAIPDGVPARLAPTLCPLCDGVHLTPTDRPEDPT